MSAANDEPWIGKVYRASRSAKFWVTTLVLAPGLFVAIYMLGAFVTNLDRVMALGWSIIRGLPVAAFVLLLVSGYVGYGIHIWRMKLEIQNRKLLIRWFFWPTHSIRNSEVRSIHVSRIPSGRRTGVRVVILRGKNGRCLARLAGYFDDFDEIVAWARHTFRADQSI